MKNWIFFLFKIFFTFLLLFVIFTKINIERIFEIYKKINFLFIIISLFFYYFAFFFLSIRWKILFLEYKKHFKIWEIFKIYLLGMFINIISPATLGVDLVRGYIASKKIENVRSFFLLPCLLIE